jgi:hypothetical protein
MVAVEYLEHGFQPCLRQQFDVRWLHRKYGKPSTRFLQLRQQKTEFRSDWISRSSPARKSRSSCPNVSSTFPGSDFQRHILCTIQITECLLKRFDKHLKLRVNRFGMGRYGRDLTVDTQ